MNLKLLLVCLIKTVILETQRREIATILLPKTANTLKTFEFSADEHALIDMSVTCSSGINRVGLFFGGYNVCNSKFRIEKPNDVNVLVSGLVVNMINNVDLSKEKVQYAYKVFSDDGKELLDGKIVQRFSIATEIPFTQVGKEIKLNKLTKSFRLKVLQIDSGYLRNSNDRNFNLNFLKRPESISIEPEFEGGWLYLIGKGFIADKSTSNIEFSVEDRMTLLKSKVVGIKVASDHESISDGVSFGRIILTAHLLLLVFVLIYILVRIGTGAIDVPDNPNGLQEHDGEASAVLTKSVLKQHNESKNSIAYHDCTQEAIQSNKVMNDSLDFGENSHIATNRSANLNDSIIADIRDISSILKTDRA